MELGFLWSIIIGLIAGAIAGWIMKGSGYGFLLNLGIGLLGGLLGGWVYGLLGLSTNSIFGFLLMSVIGAVLLIWIVSLFTRKRRV